MFERLRLFFEGVRYYSIKGLQILSFFAIVGAILRVFWYFLLFFPTVEYATVTLLVIIFGAIGFYISNRLLENDNAPIE